MTWLLIAVAVGIIQGSFTVPMKYTRRWKWENTWGMWSVWALLVLPWALATVSVPNLFDVYRAVPASTLALVFGMSLCWGVGAITFGMGVHYVGIALGFAIIMGLSVAMGSLIPLFMQPANVLTREGLLIIAAVTVMVVGIIVGAKAAMLKDRALAAAGRSAMATAGPSMLKGILICIIAGSCGALINIAYVLGQPIQAAAVEQLHVDPTFAPNAIWAISLSGGFIVNFGYCCWLMARNGTWRLFRAEGGGIHWLHTAAMGLMWFGSFAAYGICAYKLGTLGPAMGFAIYIGTAIITGNLWGLITGEWKGSGTKPLCYMAVSVAILLLGIGVSGWSKMGH